MKRVKGLLLIVLALEKCDILANLSINCPSVFLHVYRPAFTGIICSLNTLRLFRYFIYTILSTFCEFFR